MKRPIGCSHPGCQRAWTVNFGRRLCAYHAVAYVAPRKTLTIPKHEPVRPFIEPVERDEQPEF